MSNFSKKNHKFKQTKKKEMKQDKHNLLVDLVEVGEICKIWEKNRIWEVGNMNELCFCSCHITLK